MRLKEAGIFKENIFQMKTLKKLHSDFLCALVSLNKHCNQGVMCAFSIVGGEESILLSVMQPERTVCAVQETDGEETIPLSVSHHY